MSLDKHLVRSCPFLLGRDYISLYPGFTLDGERLHDRTLGLVHIIHPPGDILLRKIHMGTLYKSLERLAAKNKVQSVQLSELLGFLNCAGGLVREKQTPHTSLYALMLRVRCLGIGVRFAPLAHRGHASAKNVFMYVLRAASPVVLAIMATCALAYTSGLASANAVATLGGSGIGLFILSIHLHEMAHVRALTQYGSSVDVLQRGMHIGVIHSSVSATHELRSALAGPLHGGAFCLLMAALFLFLEHSWIAGLSLGLSALHVASLLPWYGDGAVLHAAFRKRIQS